MYDKFTVKPTGGGQEIQRHTSKGVSRRRHRRPPRDGVINIGDRWRVKPVIKCVLCGVFAKIVNFSKEVILVIILGLQ